MLKSILAPTNAMLSSELSCSFIAAAALTGVPLLLGAGSALGSSMMAQKIGKRLFLVIGAILMLAGSVWNIYISNIYAEFMCARAFQGIGWGVIDGVLSTAIVEITVSFYWCGPVASLI